MEETIIKEVVDDFIPVFEMLSGTENYSITLGDSYGKGLADKNSDIDFRLYYEKAAPREVRREAYLKMNTLIEKWSERGITVEQVWPRIYMDSLTYWRNDYHYKSKVNRKDIAFLASINARLLQDILQILYAVNEVFYGIAISLDSGECQI